MKIQTRDALCAGLVAVQIAWAVTAGAVPSAPASRYASIVIDAQTGDVLYERNADLPRYPASLTKIMTLYMTFEALSQKKLSLSDSLPVSAAAAGREPSRLGLTPGSTLRLEDAIRGMTTKSANDAASVVAEALGKGSEARFAEAMTAKAKALGLKQTRFLNASGLPGQGHVSSARDLATLCAALLRDFPDYYRYFSTSAFEFKGKRYPNQNRFLRSYFGADGIKTGFVHASGHNLAASAIRRDKRLIAIVLGGDTQLWTREHATRLMDVAYAKIDPDLAFMASNAVNAPSSATVAAATYATPAGAVTLASATVQPVATANVTSTVQSVATATVTSAVQPVASSGVTSAVQPVAISSVTSATQPVATSSVTAPAAPTVKAAAAAPVTTGSTPAASTNDAAQAVPTNVAPPTTTAATTATAAAGKEPSVAAPTSDATPARGDWAVQVGLFRDESVARKRAEEARNRIPIHLRGADLVVAGSGDGIHLASRLTKLSEQDAREACSQLQRGRLPCVIIPPGRPMIVATN